MLRIASVIRAVLAEAIRERLSDPRIEQLTSITHVDVSADLSVARVHVSVMAPAARQKLTLEALRHASGRLRTLVARELTVRQAPQITFLLDESLQRGFETVQQIDRLMAELDGNPADEPSAGGDDSCAPATTQVVSHDALASDNTARRGDERGDLCEAGREDS